MENSTPATSLLIFLEPFGQTANPIGRIVEFRNALTGFENNLTEKENFSIPLPPAKFENVIGFFNKQGKNMESIQNRSF